MANFPLTNVDATTSTHRALFDQVDQAFGTIPNMFKAIGHSQAALESMWTSFGALSSGKLEATLGEKIAVLVADINRCEYCLAAHTQLGKAAGASVTEMLMAQSGSSEDAKTQAALTFAEKLVKQRAKVSRSDLDTIRAAGFNDEVIAEIVAHVALNIFTNYTNIALDVEVDFPKVALNPA